MSETILSAVASGDLGRVKACLKTDEVKQLNFCGPEGEAPIHAAAKSKNVAILKALLDAGANPNLPNEETGTAKGYTAAHIAAKVGDADTLLALGKAKADFNREAGDGWRPLHTAAFSGKLTAMQVLLDNGADINGTNSHGLTALTFAVNHGRVNDVKELLRRKARLDIIDVHGDTLLHHALHHQMNKLFEGEYEIPECQFDIVVQLALAGIEVEKLNFEKVPAWEFAPWSSIGDYLKLLSHYREAITRSQTDWNYMTILAAKVEHFAGMGFPMKAAVDLYEVSHRLESERHQVKKEKEEERATQGGCPVIRSKKNKKKTEADAEAMKARGEDPSEGACPFFKKKDDEAAAPAPEAAAHGGHSQAEADALKAKGEDPSAGKCPFFKKDEKSAAPTQSAAAPTAPTPAVAAPAATYAAPTKPELEPELSLRYLMANRTQLMMCLLCFFFGMIVEQKMSAIVGR